MYQSHKGWTSNHTPQEKWQPFSGINPTRGGRQTCNPCWWMGADQSINPTRGGRQTQVRALFLMICPGINPTRGGRQTGTDFPLKARFKMYQSHKGWTSNYTQYKK